MHDLADWRTVTDPDEKRHAYYASREWGLKKEAVRQRAKGMCERCKVNRMRSVHHLSYARLYDEELEDLQALCEPCHQFTHGKSHFDPRCGTPVHCCGREVKSIYLAGKCGPDLIDSDPDTGRLIENWRCSITRAYFVGHREDVPGNNDQMVDLNDGRSLVYCGPHIGYDHGCMATEAHGASMYLEDPKRDTLKLATTGLLHANLVFAWIDCLDCFGTIAEVGYARALANLVQKEKVIVIAGPKYVEDLWFVYAMADKVQFGIDDPKRVLEGVLE
jgi:hypothetical protein